MLRSPSGRLAGVGVPLGDSNAKGERMGEREHEHKWGPVEYARFTGNPHRRCTVEGCRFVSLDIDESDGEQDD